ncbi:hypothetical protein [Rhizobium leguminosarum]|jgi:hypothetical protein|nr:hypothetical protein [Rhizobium leguminosarum]
MYDINQPIFTYAGALVPEAKPSKFRNVLLAVCAGLLLAALAI